ncbi:hypothetical protein T4A_10969 [Trichinella pseudospiralis]|uniref:Uncharacterized protein n=1 Tax=Trichinella pseudospiralis TaxID=6337 RepID=A0A0V1E4D0_TRIPS|nr:hypothetical protein T4A_10969 [Trichinella pseudospiralis]
MKSISPVYFSLFRNYRFWTFRYFSFSCENYFKKIFLQEAY